MKASIKAALFTLSIAAAFGAGYWLQHGKPQQDTIAARQTVIAPSLPGTAVPDFASIVASQGPAVVNISVSGTAKGAEVPMSGVDPDNPLFDFFKHFQGAVPKGRVPIQGQGSGFIVSDNGLILTNAHVVADADEVVVKLTDRRELKAKILGLDKQTDIALLKVEASHLPIVKIGNPLESRVGEWVVAIGAPFGFENSVTAGIISAKSRSLPDEGYVPFMQTDVAINPGNSGGPLINTRGEVIGINSQIYSRNGGYQGLSFAIPIDVAMKVEKQLLDHGKVRRGRIGVVIQEVDQSLAQSFGLDKPMGALVSSVEPGSPAERAGLLAGDIILKFNNETIDRSSELPIVVSGIVPGTKVAVEVWRKSRTNRLSITVADMPIPVKAVDTNPQSGGKLGLMVRLLTTEERKSVNEGVIVVEEVVEGPAQNAGIQVGDILISMNGNKINSIENLRAMVEKSAGQVALLVQRGEGRLFIALQLK